MGLWLHRISHRAEVSYPLLNVEKEEGYLSIGYGGIAERDDLLGLMLDKAKSRESKAEFFEVYSKGWAKSRWCLFRFLVDFEMGDWVLIPSWGVFHVYEIIGMPQTVGSLKLQNFKDWNGKEVVFKDNNIFDDSGEMIDIGFVIRVKKIETNISRYDYATGDLAARMKYRMANADISDLQKEVGKAISAYRSDTPLSLYAAVESTMSKELLKVINKEVTPDKLERLIKWFFEKMGAAVHIPPKNESGKKDGADADVWATFESIKTIIFVQAKKHMGITDSWAVEQIYRYNEQKDAGDEYTCITWVISLADCFSDEAEKKAKEYHVRLVNGIEFCRMLLDSGIVNIDQAFK